MSSQSGDAQLFGGKLLVPAEGEVAGRLVVKLVWGQRGLEGSSTTQESAATSQLSMLSPLGSTQSSKVLLVHVPVWVGRPREHTPGPAVQQGKPPGPPAPAQVPGGHLAGPKGTDTALTGLPQGPDPDAAGGPWGPKQCAEPPLGSSSRSQPLPGHPPQVGRGGQGLTTLALCVVAEQAVGQPDGEGEAVVGHEGAQLGDVNHVVDARLIHPQPELGVGQCHGLPVDLHLQREPQGGGQGAGRAVGATPPPPRFLPITLGQIFVLTNPRGQVAGAPSSGSPREAWGPRKGVGLPTWCVESPCPQGGGTCRRDLCPG